LRGALGSEREGGLQFGGRLEHRAAQRLRLRGGSAGRLFKHLPGAGQSIPLGMNQALDLQRQLDIAAAVKALASAALVGLELGKLRLPESQYIGLHITDLGHIPNLEIKTVGDRGLVEGALLGELRSHEEVEEGTGTLVENLALNAV
jgi:hypothetical protein